MIRVIELARAAEFKSTSLKSIIGTRFMVII